MTKIAQPVGLRTAEGGTLRLASGPAGVWVGKVPGNGSWHRAGGTASASLLLLYHKEGRRGMWGGLTVVALVDSAPAWFLVLWPVNSDQAVGGRRARVNGVNELGGAGSQRGCGVVGLGLGAENRAVPGLGGLWSYGMMALDLENFGVLAGLSMVRPLTTSPLGVGGPTVEPVGDREVTYELYTAESGVLVRDRDTEEYVRLLAKVPVTEGLGPVHDAWARGEEVRLRVLG